MAKLFNEEEDYVSETERFWREWDEEENIYQAEAKVFQEEWIETLRKEKEVKELEDAKEKEAFEASITTYKVR